MPLPQPTHDPAEHDAQLVGDAGRVGWDIRTYLHRSLAYLISLPLLFLPRRDSIVGMSESLSARPVRISGHGGDEIEAYFASPDGDGPRGGVVVIHHMPGYDRATKEITRRFAELGYDAICPNLHWREAP